MAAAFFFLPFPVAFTSNGLPAPGARVFFYLTGTLTPADSYSTSDMETAHANPVVANGAGHLPSIYLNSAITYRVIIKDRSGNTLEDIDPYIPGTAAGAELLAPYSTSAAASATAAAVAQTGAAASASAAAGSATASATSAAASEAARVAAELVAAQPGTPGPPGTNGGIGSSAGNAALFAAASGMEIGAGITSFETAGYSVVGKGAGRYVYDAAVDAAFVAANPRWAFLAADGRGFRLDLRQGVDVQMFGAAADFATDDLPAFEAALAAITFGDGGILSVPPGGYYCSNTLNIHVTVNIVGGGSGQNANHGTVIRFANDCNGIVFNHVNTHGDGLGTQGQAGASTLQGIALWGGNVDVNSAGVPTSYAAGDSTSGHGIRIRGAFIRLIDVSCMFWGGNGFNINCTAGSGGATEGNANSFYLENCQAQYNRLDGYLIAGSDANAGTINTCSAISNAGCGFKEFSFLGNTYIQCHARDNGIVDSTGSNGPVGVCNDGVNDYYLVAGQEAAGSTTVPGTNSAVWLQKNDLPSQRVWVTGQQWQLGAPYATNPGNVNARNVFLGCYCESGQTPVQATYPSLFLGGLIDEVGLHGSATWLAASGNGLVSTTGFRVATPTRTISWGNAQDQTLWTQFLTGVIDWSWKVEGAGETSAVSLRIGSRGLLDVQPGNASFPHSVRLRLPTISDANGSFDGGRVHATITALSDLTGKTVAAGDTFNFSAPVGYKGITFVGGGAVGAGAVPAYFGKIGFPINEGGAARTASLADAGCYIRFTAPATFTIPPDSSVLFPTGTEIDGIQAGAGALTIAAGAGVTLNSFGADLTLSGQFSSFTAKKVGADAWDVVGKF